MQQEVYTYILHQKFSNCGSRSYFYIGHLKCSVIIDYYVWQLHVYQSAKCIKDMLPRRYQTKSNCKNSYQQWNEKKGY